MSVRRSKNSTKTRLEVAASLEFVGSVESSNFQEIIRVRKLRKVRKLGKVEVSSDFSKMTVLGKLGT